MSNSQKHYQQVRRYVSLALLVFALLIFPYETEPAVHAAATLVVTNVNDDGPGSLRQAIIDANSIPGLDTIAFNIAGPFPIITPFLSLPTITDSVVIDGTTQPGFAGTPIVQLSSSEFATVGLTIDAPGCTIRALVINGFRSAGISLFRAANGTDIKGSYIGTDATGSVAMPNGAGVSVQSSNNVIGGTIVSARNVISGNSNAGIQIAAFCCTGTIPVVEGNLIQGNYIGVNAAGNAAVPNQRQGVLITTSAPDTDVHGNTVGGTAPGAGNVISGNGFEGVSLGSFQTTANVVQGNFIGTDATGSFAIPNDRDGVLIDNSRNNLIGGSEPGARNVISGNGGTGGGNGITLRNSGNIIRGNLVGTNAAGNAPLSNLLHGIAVTGTNNTIGGPNAGEGNVIAFNGFDGIAVAGTGASGNSLRGNSIFSNGWHSESVPTIGIDLGSFGVTQNDAGDSDTGSNGLQNFPVITSVTAGASSVNVKGTLNSTANTTFDLDFYANSVCDGTGFGEGARRIGSASTTSDSSGALNFDVTFVVILPPNQVLTATATDPAGNTSEFSQCTPNSPAVGSVGFASSFSQVTEQAAAVLFVVNRTGGSAGSLTVEYTVRGVTATAGQDFAPTQGILTFADGETSKSLSLTMLEDNVAETIETATVTLSTSSDLDRLGSQSVATLTIFDNEPTPSLSIGDVTASEGNSGTTNFNFPVTLSGVSSRTVSVGFTTTDNTAGAGTDYLTPVTNSISIPAGQTSGVITVQVSGDVSVEPDEAFFVNLGFQNEVIILDAQGKGTILNDDGGSTPAPLVLMEEESPPFPNQAAALDSVLFLRDPFPLINDKNLLLSGPDRNTRVILFVKNLQLVLGQPASSVVINLRDSFGQVSDIAAVDVRPIADTDLAQGVL